ncbi:MAG: hypothetical protein IJ900_01245 [Paludibacteraceae bacterium]|nr:hypothetical protein [Paludibacteraceae bacterium]
MRKIFSFLMAAVLSISTAFATTVYCKVTQGWWTQDGAAVGVHYWGGASAGTAWPGVRMTPVSGEEGTWSYDVPADVEGLIFTRVNGSGDIIDYGAKTTDLSLPTDGKNLYTITSTTAVWGDPGVTGEWSTYGGDPSGAIKLTFTYYDKTDGDGSTKLSTVAAIFDAACQKYVDAVLVGTQVYAGRKYKEGNDSIFSNLKLGSSSAAGELKFDLANPTEVDSIVFRAAMYASNEGGEGFKVNGENFTLSAGKLIFEDKVWKPTGEVSTIDIVQNKANKGRFFLTSITIYPKASTPVPPVAAKFYVTGDSALVTDAGFAGKAWNPAAIKAEADTLVLNLKAEQYYKLKVSLDGTWNDGKVKGFNDLTEKPEGVTTDNDENIIFSLAEAGAVKVIYIAGETPIFKIAGNFYVEPTPEPAKFYVTGDSALVTDAGFAGKAWNADAIKAEADTLVLNLKAEQVYKLKVSLDGTWNDGKVKGFNDLTEKPEGVTMDNDENIIFSLAEAGAVKVIDIACETPIFKIVGNFYVEPVPPTPKYYIIGAGEAFGEWSFVPVMQDTFKLSNLAAGDYMFRVALENGNWENTKGYSDLTEKTEGLSANNDNNILFTLAEAGDVAVVYNDSVFRVIGNFYVDPTPVVPTAAVTGDMTEWGEPIPFELSEDSTFATLYNDNIKKGTYAFKMIINGDWRSNGYEFHRGFPGCAGITGNTDANMTVVIDVEGAYTFKWYFANDSLAIIYPEKPEPVLADGFYLVGKFGGVDAWDPVVANLFAANPDTEGEYQLSIDLAVDDEIKVVYVAEDVITTWYPKEGNYIVDDHHNGPTTMYFRPEYNSDWSAFGGYFYIVPTSTVGFENTAVDAKAVKVLKNGILVIEKNNKTYNVMGQMVK